MTGGYWSSGQLIGAAFGVSLAFGPVLALVLARKSVGPLKTAAWLVTWGALVIAGEHANFAITNSVRFADSITAHARYHFFMAAIYTIVGAGGLALVAHTLLSAGERVGWYAVLVALIFGGTFEVLSGATIFAHGLPPDSIPVGLALYAYFAAWGSALAIAYKPVFRSQSVSVAER